MTDPGQLPAAEKLEPRSNAVAPGRARAAGTLRIASVCKNYPSAWMPTHGVFVRRRLEALAALAEVRLIQPVPWFPLVRPLPAGWRTAAHPGSPVVWQRQPMFYLPGVFKRWDARWLERALWPQLSAWHDCGQLDLIDAHFGYPEGLGSVYLAQRLRVPVFITLRGLESVYLRKPRIGPRLAWALQQATGLVAVSHSLAEVAKEHGVPAERVRVIPNAVDDELFHPGDFAAARRSLGIEVDGPLVVSVGLLLAGKGHHLAIRALAALRARHPRARLAVLGAAAHEPGYPGQLARLTQELGLADAVLLPGAVPPDQVATWLQAADVFALATFREGCCNAVLEALASGLPVVTTPVGDNARYVRDDENGYLVPVDNAAALGLALGRALDRGWDRQAIAAHLRGDGWAGVARQLMAFFQERLAAVKRGSG